VQALRKLDPWLLESLYGWFCNLKLWRLRHHDGGASAGEMGLMFSHNLPKELKRSGAEE